MRRAWSSVLRCKQAVAFSPGAPTSVGDVGNDIRAVLKQFQTDAAASNSSIASVLSDIASSVLNFGVRQPTIPARRTIPVHPFNRHKSTLNILQAICDRFRLQ